MSIIGYGPLEAIDGPLPIQPPYGLLQAAAAPASGVRIVTDVDGGQIERWLNGVEVHPYPTDHGDTHSTCAPGSEQQAKRTGTPYTLPQFGPITIYLPETCTAVNVGMDQAAFRARAVLALGAIESAIVANEFMTGDREKLNPALMDGNGTFPNGNNSTSVMNGLALLEAEIAASGKLGLIHLSPRLLVAAAERCIVDNKTGVIRTMNGNVVIPDAGYSAATLRAPFGEAAPTGTQEWAYATGPIDVRRSEVFTTPDTLAEALDRRANSITYRAERYYLVDWDTSVQAAVLIDRCKTTC